MNPKSPHPHETEDAGFFLRQRYSPPARHRHMVITPTVPPTIQPTTKLSMHIPPQLLCKQYAAFCPIYTKLQKKM